MFEKEDVPEFIEWENVNDNFTWLDFLSAKSDLYTALSFSKLFAPDLIEHKGSILLKDSRQLASLSSIEENATSALQIERAINTQWMCNFFYPNMSDDGYRTESLESFAKILKYFWELTFANRYPEYKMIVQLYYDDHFEYDWFITTYSKASLETYNNLPEPKPFIWAPPTSGIHTSYPRGEGNYGIPEVATTKYPFKHQDCGGNILRNGYGIRPASADEEELLKPRK